MVRTGGIIVLTSSKHGKTSYGFFALALLAVIPGGLYLYFARFRALPRQIG
jgi:hypothetical protein